MTRMPAPEAFVWGMFVGALLCLITFIVTIGDLLGEI